MTIACDDVFSFHTHWLGKRSYMCSGAECPACVQQVGAKWLGLLFVAMKHVDGAVVQHGLLELTEAAYYRLRDLAQIMGSDVCSPLSVMVARRARKSPLKFWDLEESVEVPVAKVQATARKIADGVSTLYGLPAIGKDEAIQEWSAKAAIGARQLLTNQLRNLI